MFSTRFAALRRAALNTIACATLAFALMLTLTTTTESAAAKPKEPCANRLCTKDKPKAKSCWSLHSRSQVSRCFIKRAAKHYHQPVSQAFYIAHRESRYNYRVTNSSSGAAGLYQFMPSTWESTPYHKHSPYHPRWASLAAMWMWKHGGQYHWNA
jgi:hypothetical protein